MAMMEGQRVEILKDGSARLDRVHDLIREGDLGGALVALTAATKVLVAVLSGLDWDWIRDGERKFHEKAVEPVADLAQFLADAAGWWGSADRPANAFFVGVNADRVVFARPIPPAVSRGEALNLAAWIVAVADRQTDGAMFRALLDAVRRT